MLDLLQNAQILVITHGREPVMEIARKLADSGCRILEAHTGREALQLVLDMRPDAIVLQADLPDLTGSDLCKILRQSPSTSGIPIIQIASMTSQSTCSVRGSEGGADAYLAHPVDALQLIISLAVLLRTRQAEERFRLLARATGTFIYDLDVPGGNFTSVEGLECLLGYSPEEVDLTFEWWCSRISPEDLGAYKLEHSRLQSSMPFLKQTYRVQSRDGSWLDVEDTLQAAFGRDGSLQRIVGGVLDITERKQGEAKLNQAMVMLDNYNRKLEDAVRERTSKLQEMVQELEHFSYSLVHDMRAPLRALQAFGHLLLAEENGVDPEMRREYLQRLTNAARRMDMLITDALSFSKAVLRPMPLKPINPGMLLASIIDTYPYLQPYKERIHIASSIPEVIGNEAGLTQCFSNLLENAVKFTKDGVLPEVRVWADSGSSAVRIWVEDNGVGIPSSFRSKLFGMFARGSNSGAGTGIGLALVRKNAERMGGRAGVESTEGHGSRFWIEIPASGNQALERGK